ncbi:MAG: hypothetical protein ACKVTZ_02755 [Bacteroidia bacterium]
MKTKSDIDSLITEEFNGVTQKFLVAGIPKTKQEKLWSLLSILSENLTEFEVVYEGKINYGFRNKRIEIVLYQFPVLLLGEISDAKNVDKKALTFEELIDFMKKQDIYQDIIIVGGIFLEELPSETTLTELRTLLTHPFLFLNIQDDSFFDTIKEYVLSHQ